MDLVIVFTNKLCMIASLCFSSRDRDGPITLEFMQLCSLQNLKFSNSKQKGLKGFSQNRFSAIQLL